MYLGWIPQCSSTNSEGQVSLIPSFFGRPWTVPSGCLWGVPPFLKEQPFGGHLRLQLEGEGKDVTLHSLLSREITSGSKPMKIKHKKSFWLKLVKKQHAWIKTHTKESNISKTSVLVQCLFAEYIYLGFFKIQWKAAINYLLKDLLIVKITFFPKHRRKQA